ncbi:hypothetical protein [Streptomyces sp. NPDC004324]
MDSELAALTASGATTLVSLMVTDSWTHARELVRRFLSRNDPGTSMITDLDAAQAGLLDAPSAEHLHLTRDTAERLDAYLRHLLEAQAVSDTELRALIAELQHLRGGGARPGTVHNNINGGVQYGPVIQSGRITGLTIHAHQPDPPQG